MATTSEINSVQGEALENIVYRLGALRGSVQEEVKIAGLGSEQDIFGTTAMCIVIVGASTDMAIISNNSILYSYAIHCAGDYLTQSFQNSQPGEAMSNSKATEVTTEEISEHVIQFQLREHIIPAIHRVPRTGDDKAAGSASDSEKKVKTEKSTKAVRERYEWRQLIIEQNPSCEVLIKDGDLGLKKVLEHNLNRILTVNIIYKKYQGVEVVKDEVLELFMELNTNDGKLDVPTLYAISKQGIAQ
uniref:GTP-binding protein TypA/BipA like protein n=1 Tax=Eufriesea mexicana TaxID=516756 RepID=A0A310SN38_9HYME